jgi:Ca2+/Na+ antiporter
MVKQEKDTLSILAEMRRKLEDRKTSNRSATFFVAFGYLTGFVLLMYMGQMDILSYVSVFVVLLFIIVYKNFRQTKDDIIAIDDLYLEYSYLKSKK